MVQLGLPLFPGGIELAGLLFFFFIPILVALGVYYDAQSHGIDNAELWGLGIAILFLSSMVLNILGIILGIVGVISYFSVRNDQLNQTDTEKKEPSTAVSKDDRLDTKESVDITVSEELVDELSDRKKRGESYEDVIWRLIENHEK